MNFRYMRILVMFDLPVLTSEDKREYRKFKKYLEKNGYLMLQESIYCKLALNNSVAIAYENSLEKNKPKKGLVFLLKLTENQFGSMKYIVGDKQSEIVDSNERFLEL